MDYDASKLSLDYVDAHSLTLANPTYPPLVLGLGKSKPASLTVSINTAQKASWAAHLILALAEKEDIPVNKISWTGLTRALEIHAGKHPHEKAKVPGAAEVAWSGNAYSFKLKESTVTSDYQIYLSENFAPGAVEAFYVGPYGSMLWWALGGDGYCLKQVISRFSLLIGDISESGGFFYGRDNWSALCDPEFWIELVEAMPIISLKVLSYHIALYRSAETLRKSKLASVLDDANAGYYINEITAYNLHGVIAARLLNSMTIITALEDIGLNYEIFFRDNPAELRPKYRPLTNANVELASLGRYDERALSGKKYHSYPIRLTSEGMIWVPTEKNLFKELISLWRDDRSLNGLAGLAEQREAKKMWMKSKFKM